jgi:hypothetical protein
MKTKGKKNQAIPPGCVRLTPAELKTMQTVGYVERRGQFYYGDEDFPDRTPDEQLAELRKLPMDKAIRMHIGIDSEMGNRVTWIAQFSHEFHDDLDGGIVVILPTEADREEAAKVFQYLLKMTLDPDPAVWNTLLQHPFPLAAHFVDIRQQLWDQEKNQPREPNDPQHWSELRKARAEEALHTISGFALMMTPREQREKMINGGVFAAEVAQDLQVLVERLWQKK